MDKLVNYRKLIQNILTDYHEWVSGSSNQNSESCLVFDEKHDHYMWIDLGWQGKKRTKNTQVHIRIKDNKIWIEEDWTEEGIANELLKLNVPASDIVLAFHPPEDRKYTDFAIA
ncbi:XisI protein [Aphanothece hegewaldii CCALA 016]|uniref:XisI protein n=1 Tax=Aphanothece hegewaldii CCALA 016 TaxID=2107694 RepID=A0A2T1LTG7_9CHRO|nr:XisI protein [Aphanothece hegewaldii]PSF34225.1 XisI protein [Aphanothece hegewaldii CCALA 016]